MEKVIIAMSGGVDSSVAALLVRQMGYDPVGMMLKLHAGDEGVSQEGLCGSLADAEDARGVANLLGFPFHVVDETARFETEVIDRFVNAYTKGETPNPCIDCNRHLKFDRMLHRARGLGADKIATGHYARIEQGDNGRFLLKTGLDEDKDQSYMLYRLTQDQLTHTLLPLGAMTKGAVRALAQQHGLLNAKKRDSQDICFVPDGDYAGFIRRRCGKEARPGDFIGEHGEVYGQHRGIVHYTVGQRKGLGLSFPQPMYVGGIDPEKNQVLLCEEKALYRKTLLARELNLISCEGLFEPVRVEAKVRYRHKKQPATAVQTGPDELQVVFDEPQRAITKGQAVVLYTGDTVVGGGVISDVADP